MRVINGLEKDTERGLAPAVVYLLTASKEQQRTWGVSAIRCFRVCSSRSKRRVLVLGSPALSRG